MRDQRLQLQKEEAIKADYARMASERKYSRTYILDQIALKYHLKDSTVERIVWGEYDANRQRQATRSTPPSSRAIAA